MREAGRVSREESPLPSDAERSAVHEAGHAVMAVRQRRRFRTVSIVENDHSQGRILGLPTRDWFRPTLTRESRLRRILEEDILVFLAGPLAEARLAGANSLDEIDPRTIVGSAYDNQVIEQLAAYMSASEDETQAFIHWLTIHAWNWVHNDTWWCAVERVAQQLSTARTLRSRDVKQLVFTTRDRYIREIVTTKRSRSRPPRPAVP
jgi:hypothetical protein